MYCRVCNKVRQDRCERIYCSINGRGVGLNQVCCIGKFELDKRVLEEIEEIQVKGDE